MSWKDINRIDRVRQKDVMCLHEINVSELFIKKKRKNILNNKT